MQAGWGITDGWIGRYAIQARLGEGGMAETWLCRAPDGSRSVVVKTLRAGCRSRPYQAMFRDEATVGIALHHPNVAQVFEFGAGADGPYLVQQYVDGPNLLQLLRARDVADDRDLRVGARIVVDVARALDHAWRACDRDGRPMFVVHRDVSPSNVLVGSDGVTRLVDFGVAMFVGREARTEAGVLKGKLRFMAPEVLMDEAWSHQSDLYSLGMVLHWLLVGRLPTWGEAPDGRAPAATTGLDGEPLSERDEVLRRLHGPPVPPSMHRPDLPAALEDVVLRCLDPRPTRRYARAAHLAQALEDWMRADPAGLVSDAEVAAAVAQSFRDPSTDWRAALDFSVSASFTPVPAAAGARAPRRSRAVRRGLTLGGAVAVGLVGGALLMARPTAPGPAPAPVPATSDVASGFDRLRGAVAPDTDEEAVLQAQLAAARALRASDPEGALQRLRALALLHPRSVEVKEALEATAAEVRRRRAPPRADILRHR